MKYSPKPKNSSKNLNKVGLGFEILFLFGMPFNPLFSENLKISLKVASFWKNIAPDAKICLAKNKKYDNNFDLFHNNIYMYCDKIYGKVLLVFFSVAL